MNDRMFRHAHVLTMDPEIGDLERGDVLVRDGRVAAVGEDLAAGPGTEVVDASGCVLLPGFVDTHRHTWQAVLRGVAPGFTLRDYFTRILAGYGPALTDDEIHDGTLLGARAALASGITTVQVVSNTQDTPSRTDAVLAAHRGSGLRTVFAYGKSTPAIARSGTVLPDDVRRVRRDHLSDPDALVTMALVTESGGDDADERANAGLAEELDLPVARHFSSRDSADRLRRLGVLRPGTTFIHASDASEAELDVVADSGGTVSLSPAIEMIMGHGYPVVASAWARPRLPVTLSSDVEVTVSGDMFTQMRAAYLAARQSWHDAPSTTTVTVRDVLHMATLGGARGLGLDDRTGSVTPGKHADLLLLRLDRPDVAPVHDPYSRVVLQAGRSHVDHVLVEGRVKVAHGRPVDDSGALIARAQDTARRFATRSAGSTW